MRWTRGVFVALVAALLLALGIQPANAATVLAHSQVTYGYTYDTLAASVQSSHRTVVELALSWIQAQRPDGVIASGHHMSAPVTSSGRWIPATYTYDETECLSLVARASWPSEGSRLAIHAELALVAVAAVAANSATQGYSSFAKAKTALGSPGPGNVYDHVVEQSQIARSGFTPESIHNPANLNPVSARVNQLKANYYSTKPDWTGGGTVRDWLNGQSFADQHAFGMQVTQDILGGKIGGAG